MSKPAPLEDRGRPVKIDAVDHVDVDGPRSRAGSVNEHGVRHETADDPVRRVHDFGDLQVAGQRAQHVGICARQARVRARGGRSSTAPPSGALSIRSDSTPVVAYQPASVHAWRERPRRAAQRRRRQRVAVLDRHPDRRSHGTFDTRDRDFAVTLGGVGIADREQPARHADGKVQHGARGQMAQVDVAATCVRRWDRRRRACPHPVRRPFRRTVRPGSARPVRVRWCRRR